MTTRATTLGAALLAVLAAAGCDSGFRQSVGLEAPPPDEFLVVARRPLEMPPSFEALPPPNPGAPSRVEPNPLRDAQRALAGPAAPAAAIDVPASASRGEAALLSAAGAAAADPNIRETLAAEAPAPERRYGLTSFLGYPIQQDPEERRRRLDAAEEARRLQAEGVPTVAPPAPPPAGTIAQGGAGE